MKGAGAPKLPPRPPKKKSHDPTDQNVSTPSGDQQPTTSQHHFNTMEEAFNALSSGQHTDLLEKLSSSMGISPQQLQATFSAMKSGNISALPPEVVQRALEMRDRMSSSNTQLTPGVASPMVNNSNNTIVPPFSSSRHSLHESSILHNNTTMTISPDMTMNNTLSVTPPNNNNNSINTTTTTTTTINDNNNNNLLDDEERQNWLVMYRGVYLKHSDAVFGPVFVFFVSSLFWARILPFGVAVWLVPLLFLISVKIILVNGAGFQPKLLPSSRLPASMVITLELTAILTFFISILSIVQDLWAQCFILITSSSIAYYLHYLAITRDPGFLPQGEHALPPSISPEQLAMMQASNPYHCLRCGIYKPIRSSHCSVCNRCVADFDHHCPVVANCIGRKNARVFAGYLVSLFIAECVWMSLAMTFFKRALQSGIGLSDNTNSNSDGNNMHHRVMSEMPSIWSVLWHCLSLGRVFPGTMFMMCVVTFIIAGTLFLACRQLWCIAGNLTTAEWILRDHKNYLKAQRDGTYYNPFDLGVVENCLQFWMNSSENKPDWYSVYSDRKDLDPEKETKKVSVMGALRAVNKSKLALEEARLKKKAEREAWLLKNYGGQSV